MKITLRLLLSAFFLTLLVACGSSGQEESSSDSQYALDAEGDKADIAETEDLSQLMMLGEYAYQNGHDDVAAAYYQRIAEKVQDPEVFQRSIELSLKTRNIDQALNVVNRWLVSNPDASSALQYRLLLLIKKEKYVEAAKALHEFVSKKEGFGTFSGIDIAMALLEREANSEQAINTLQEYVKLPDFEPKSLYYLAIIGMRNQEFSLVVDMAERGKKIIKSDEHKQKLALLHVKALTKLNREKDALVVLNSLVVEAADAKTKQSYARILSSLGQVEQAVSLLQETYADNKGDIPILLDVIGIQLDAKKFADAIKTVDQLAEVPEQAMRAKFYRGLVYEAQDKFADALNEYQSITGELRASMDIRVRIVSTLEKTQGLDAAVTFLDKEITSIEKKQERKELLSMKSYLYRDKERYPEALASLDQALSLVPEDLDVMYDKALVQEKMNDLDASEKSLLFILNRDPDNATVLNALGYMLVVNTTRFDDAQVYLERAIALEPNDPAIIDSVGWLYYKQGKLAEAEELIRKAFEQIQDPEVASHLIEILAKLGKKEEARRLLQEMLKDYPDNKLLLNVQPLL